MSLYKKKYCTYCIFLCIIRIIIIVVPTPSNDSVMGMLNYWNRNAGCLYDFIIINIDGLYPMLIHDTITTSLVSMNNFDSEFWLLSDYAIRNLNRIWSVISDVIIYKLLCSYCNRCKYTPLNNNILYNYKRNFKI